jgi:hypothetical protein
MSIPSWAIGVILVGVLFPIVIYIFMIAISPKLHTMDVEKTGAPATAEEAHTSKNSLTSKPPLLISTTSVVWMMLARTNEDKHKEALKSARVGDTAVLHPPGIPSVQ